MQTESSREQANQPTAPPPPRRSLIRRIILGFVAVPMTSLIVILGIWATAALSLANLDGVSRRIVIPSHSSDILNGLASHADFFSMRPLPVRSSADLGAA